jgi:hypothetical protein
MGYVISVVAEARQGAGFQVRFTQTFITHCSGGRFMGGACMRDDADTGAKAREAPLASLGSRAGNHAAIGHWSSHIVGPNGLKFAGRPDADVRAAIHSWRAVGAREEGGKVAGKRPSFFPHALNLCLIHGLGTRQNVSLFESAHGPRQGPTGVRRGRICTAYVATEVSRVIPYAGVHWNVLPPRAIRSGP